MIEDVKSEESWHLFKIVNELTEGFNKLNDIGFAVSIFGSAGMTAADRYYQQAEQLAGRLAEENFAVISGGYSGIMEAASRGAAMTNEASIGLNIEPPAPDIAHTYQNLAIDFRYFFVRKIMFVKYSMAYICMPGGYDTLDELFEALTLVQSGKIYPIPIILFGREYWSGLVEWLRHSLPQSKSMGNDDLNLLTVTDDIEEVVRLICEHRAWKLSHMEDARYYQIASE